MGLPSSHFRTLLPFVVAASFVLVGLGIWTQVPQAGVEAATESLDTVQATPAYCLGVYRGDTSAGSSHYDAYPCRPDWPETGPEHLYQLQTTYTQGITLTLSHAAEPGLDLDLFLWPKGDMQKCYAADATLLLSDLPPGVHTIVVDGFNQSSGPYALDVQCSQRPLATPTPTMLPHDTPTPTPTVSPTATLIPTATPTQPRLTYYSYLPSWQRINPAPTPQPSVIVFQAGLDDYDGVEDSHIDAWSPTTNFVDEQRLALRQPNVVAPILKFDLTSLPQNAHIVDARLDMWSITQTNPNPADVGIYRLDRSWQAREVTWQQAASDQPWAVAGADGIPQDRESLPRHEITITESSRWYSWDVTSLVHEWVHAPVYNHGLVLKAYSPPKVYYAFASSDYPNPWARPKLTIRYWLPGSDPNAS